MNYNNLYIANRSRVYDKPMIFKSRLRVTQVTGKGTIG